MGCQLQFCPRRCRREANGSEHLQSRTMLDLHELSGSAARHATWWWLHTLAAEFSQGVGKDDRLTIITGWGRHRTRLRGSDLKREVVSLLTAIGCPWEQA